MSAQPRIAVVDVANRFLRWEDRRVVHAMRLFHRSIHVLVFDAAGRLVVQRRHRAKLTHPFYWDLSCSGHVEEPDYVAGPDDDLDLVYESVARRELDEELGVQADVTLLGRFPPSEPLHYEQIHLYSARSDGPYALQADEVEEVRRVTFRDLELLLASGDKATGTLAFFARWARDHGHWPP